MLEDSKAPDRLMEDLNCRIRTKIHIHNSHIKTFRSKIQILFFQPHSSGFQHQNSNFRNQNSQPQNSKFLPQPSFEDFTPDPHYMPYAQQTQNTCQKCGYPNHLATNSTLRKNLRVVEHKIFSIRNQKTFFAAQGSTKAQTCKESPIKKARHM